jgi:hypothetical protein
MGTSGVVLLGSPRSGTTLLRRILGAHSDIASPGETGLLRGAAKFFASETTAVGVELGVKAGLSHMGVSEGTANARLRRFVFSFMEEYAEQEGKSIWLEKDAFNGFHIDEIKNICGDEIKYICIVRHGLDVALSVEEFCQKSGSHVLNFHDYIKEYQQPLIAYTHAWVDINQSIMPCLMRDRHKPYLCVTKILLRNPRKQLIQSWSIYPLAPLPVWWSKPSTRKEPLV